MAKQPVARLPEELAEDAEAVMRVATGSCERCADLGVGQATRQRDVARVPQQRGDVGPDLVEHQLHESARIEVDEGHVRRRCSPTMSATGRFGVGRCRSPATGRVERVGRLMTL
jgi:hypothetical protein